MTNAPSYIARKADSDFASALRRGEFCYVLNSRQMGKSSLMVRSHQEFREDGYRCAVLDMTNVGSENITPLQWYKGIVKDLWRGLKLTRRTNFPFKDWWKDEEDISLSQRLSQFIKDVVLAQFPGEKIIIFIDEIDSILSLPFSVDDFFALIRFCYNQRAIDPDYKRIHFAIFGVATPADLIQNRSRTPFNIGTPIYLEGFTQAEAQFLAAGLSVQAGDAGAVLKAVISWTNGQPFLTQKLCQLVIRSSQGAVAQPLTIPPGNEPYWVDKLVRSRILHRWESQDEPEHLRTIRNRILHNPDIAGRLLALYQQVLLSDVPADDSRDQVELILSGLVHRTEGCLRVKNRIYAEIFNADWIQQQLDNLRPYAQQLGAWRASQQTDESRLLRGQALEDAQSWAQGKRLSDLDYQYLAASVESDRKAIQQGLEAQRLEAVEAQLAEEQARRIQEKRTLKFQRLLSVVIGGALVVTTSLGLLALRQSQNAKVQEIEALETAANGSFDAHRQLDAVVQALRARKNLAGLARPNPELEQAVKTTLQRVMLGINEANRFNFPSEVKSGVFSPDGQLIAIATAEGLLSLRKVSGEVVWEMTAHDASIDAVAFSLDGQIIATGSTDKTVKLWRLDGSLISTPVTHSEPITHLGFLPDNQGFVAAGKNRAGRWQLEGQPSMMPDGGLKTISADGSMLLFHSLTEPNQAKQNQRPQPERQSPPDTVTITPQINATRAPLGSFSQEDSLVRRIVGEPAVRIGDPNRKNTLVFDPQGNQLAHFVSEHGPIFAAAISTDNQLIATAGINSSVNIWEKDGKFVQTLHGNKSDVRKMAFSPDGELLATAGDDKVIRLWQVRGGLVKTFEGHQAEINTLMFSPDGAQLMSTANDQTLRLWQVRNTQHQVLAGHGDYILHLAFNDRAQLLSSSLTRWLNVWQQVGDRTQSLPIQQIPSTEPRVAGMAAYQQEMAIALADGRIKIWKIEDWSAKKQETDPEDTEYPPNQILQVGSRPRRTLFFHSPDGQQLAIVTLDNSVKLWRRDHTGLFPINPTASIDNINQPTTIAFSPDGKLIAIGASDRTLTLLDAEGNRLKTIAEHKAAIVDVAFSPDGQWIATATTDRHLQLWPVAHLLAESFEPSADFTFATANTQIKKLAFTLDGQMLIAALADGTLGIWERESGTLMRKLWGHESELRALAMSPDGKFIASGGRDRKIMLWNLPAILAQDEVTAACDWVSNYLAYNPLVEEHRNLCLSTP